MSGRRARSSGSSPLFLSRLFSSPRLTSPHLTSPLLSWVISLMNHSPTFFRQSPLAIYSSLLLLFPAYFLAPRPFSASSGSLLALGSRTCSYPCPWPPARNRITGRQPASPGLRNFITSHSSSYIYHTHTHTHTSLCITYVCDYLRSKIATLRRHRFRFAGAKRNSYESIRVDLEE